MSLFPDWCDPTPEQLQAMALRKYDVIIEQFNQIVGRAEMDANRVQGQPRILANMQSSVVRGRNGARVY